MKPEKAKPAKFSRHTVIYNNDEFSIAYGIWDGGDKRLAMRWNGGNDKHPGYPRQGKYPLWFQLPNESIWTSVFLEAIQKVKDYEHKIEDLDAKI